MVKFTSYWRTEDRAPYGTPVKAAMKRSSRQAAAEWQQLPTDIFEELGQRLPSHCLPTLKQACKYGLFLFVLFLSPIHSSLFKDVAGLFLRTPSVARPRILSRRPGATPLEDGIPKCIFSQSSMLGHGFKITSWFCEFSSAWQVFAPS